MTDLEKIDFVLFYIKTKMADSAYWGYGPIWAHIQKTTELKINKALFDEIINKLKEDGYIVDNNTNDACRVTFRGLTFNGYVSEQSFLQMEKKRLKTLEEKTLNLSRWTTRLTIIIALGTGIAAIYYLLEILNNFFSIYPTK